MHFGDHPPPHFHVKYAGIDSRVMLAGFTEFEPKLPRNVLRKVRVWARENQNEIWAAWEMAYEKRNPGRIDR